MEIIYLDFQKVLEKVLYQRLLPVSGDMVLPQTEI